jgi:hypothetical protein
MFSDANPRHKPRPGAPAEGVVDRRQLRAVVELTLKQGFRGALKPGTGKRVQPLRQLIVSMGLFGIFFSTTVRRSEDLTTYLIFLFSTAFAIVALSVLPDTLEGRRRNIEVLSSKPIASRTLLAARAVNLLFISGLITACFGAAPLVAAKWAFACSWGLAGGLSLLLLLGSFAVVVISLTALVLAAHWLDLDRLRTLAQFVLVAINLGLIGLSFLSMRELATGSASSRISLLTIPYIKLLPSAWFADFLVSDFALSANLERAGALLIFVGAFLISTRLDLGKRYPKLIDTLLEPENRPANRPLTVSLLDAVRRIPLVGRRIIPAQAFAVATLILTTTQREVMSRLKILAPRVTLIVMFILSVTLDNRYASPLLLAFYGFIGVLSGCDLIKQSAQPEASWPLLAAPIDARQILRGMRLVITVKYFLLPAVLVAIAVFLTNPPALSAILALCYVFETRSVIALLILISPALPLSREHVTAAQLIGVGASMVVALATTVGYVVIVTTYSFSEYAGLSAGLLVFLGLLVASYLFERGAATRLRELQLEH